MGFDLLDFFVMPVLWGASTEGREAGGGLIVLRDLSRFKEGEVSRRAARELREAGFFFSFAVLAIMKASGVHWRDSRLFQQLSIVLSG